MIEVTVSLPDSLDASLVSRATEAGFQSKEEYLIALVEADCRQEDLEKTLRGRQNGPFAPLETDWKEQVRKVAGTRG